MPDYKAIIGENGIITLPKNVLSENKLSVGSAAKFTIQGIEVKGIIGENGIFTVPKAVVTQLKLKPGQQIILRY